MTADGLKALFPNLSQDEARLAGENLVRYLLLAWEIRDGLDQEDGLPSAPDDTKPTIGTDSPDS